MKRICYLLLLLLFLGQGRMVLGAELLTGVTRRSCEALLCLSSPARPSACNAALSHYFGIRKFTWPATFAARLRFLNKCPTTAPGLAREVARQAPRKWEGRPMCEPRAAGGPYCASRPLGLPGDENR